VATNEPREEGAETQMRTPPSAHSTWHYNRTFIPRRGAAKNLSLWWRTGSKRRDSSLPSVARNDTPDELRR